MTPHERPHRPNLDYERVERAILFLQERFRDQPSLGEVAAEVGLSEYHFQRLFQRWAGVSPKKFLQVLTLRDAKRLLAETRSLLDVSLEVGLSGPSRLHDLFLNIERMTPGEYRKGGEGLVIRWSVDHTPLGPALFAALDRGLCGLVFVTSGEQDALGGIAGRWPGARLREDRSALSPYVRALDERMRGKIERPVGIVLKGTALQLRVWEALLRVPSGGLIAYGDLARVAGAPNAPRAVGAAVGQNPIACLIPCHRAIHSTGAIGRYHWGSARKSALIGLEAARVG